MNTLKHQAIALLLISIPFAMLGFLTHDISAWVTAICTLISAFFIAAIDYKTN